MRYSSPKSEKYIFDHYSNSYNFWWADPITLFLDSKWPSWKVLPIWYPMVWVKGHLVVDTSLKWIWCPLFWLPFLNLFTFFNFLYFIEKPMKNCTFYEIFIDFPWPVFALRRSMQKTGIFSRLNTCKNIDFSFSAVISKPIYILPCFTYRWKALKKLHFLGNFNRFPLASYCATKACFVLLTC